MEGVAAQGLLRQAPAGRPQMRAASARGGSARARSWFSCQGACLLHDRRPSGCAAFLLQPPLRPQSMCSCSRLLESRTCFKYCTESCGSIRRPQPDMPCICLILGACSLRLQALQASAALLLGAVLRVVEWRGRALA